MTIGCLLMGHNFRRWGSWLVCEDCGKRVQIGRAHV